MGHTDFKKHILELISKEEGKPIPHAIVAQKLIQKRIAQPFNKKDIYTDIDSLLKEGSLRLTKTNKLVMGIQQSTDEVDTSIPPQQGTIAITTSGSGFITLENEKKSKYYVYRTNTNGSLSGDKVEFSVLKKQDKKDLLDAIVTSVVSRNKNFFVCTYETTESGYKLTPEDSKVFLEFVLDSTTDLVSGSVLLLQVGKFEGNKAYATVSRVIGFKTDIGVDILSLVLDNGVEPEFDQDVNDYANNIKIEIDEHQREIRHDLTNLPIITIDPATSKDFDDAIYVRKEGDDYLLSVSIADVSHYVKYDSVLDKAALKRGCSIYLVDRVIPMIPHILSNDICSINPNVDRLCLTCDMIINNNGEIKDIKVFPSIVNSHRRYSYDEVNEYFSGKSTLEKDSDEVKEVLDIGAELHAILTKSKAKRGYIQFEIPEPQIIVDEKGIPTEIRKRTSGEAQKMIEDFMVAANEAVTIYADKKGWPFVYRVHDKPSDERLQLFAIEAKKLGFKITTDLKDIQPIDVSKWLAANQDNKNLDLVNMLLLRTMAKAEYDVNNIGHFGLASKNYTHFTSPIRRYPDLMVHRIFWMNEFEKANTSDQLINKFNNELDEDCQTSSANELVAVKCERDVNDMKFAEYMSKHLNEVFNGFVTSVTNFGIFVQIENTVEGLIKLSNLKIDFFNFDPKTCELTGRNTGKKFSLGTKIKVKVISASKALRKIEFELVEFLGNR